MRTGPCMGQVLAFSDIYGTKSEHNSQLRQYDVELYGLLFNSDIIGQLNGCVERFRGPHSWAARRWQQANNTFFVLNVHTVGVLTYLAPIAA